ncbi:DUF305 domain-containing protein [Spirosoma pollinicola]|uniref:DUF305 domain-containing protein n=2 Tax=Spirosoma pollinicola TaxID=2057025 RepID=A0A2K8ZCC2_9BACT|nr:DUF305 domain-containing protein [Spirosoma pollinicola]RYF78549.1 MAG: DUF305 domain-containing protein [Cytophagaceae bacterium]
MKKGHYRKFFLMLAVSFVVMHLTMYLNTEKVDHLYLSTNRLYMTTLMITVMAVVMLLFMRSMYQDQRTNMFIIGGSVALFVAALFCVRHQVFIDDKRFMQSMIPHHSIAILVSKNADLKDPEVKKLAQDIIKAQEREIAQMKHILTRIDSE